MTEQPNLYEGGHSTGAENGPQITEKTGQDLSPLLSTTLPAFERPVGCRKEEV